MFSNLDKIGCLSAKKGTRRRGNLSPLVLSQKRSETAVELPDAGCNNVVIEDFSCPHRIVRRSASRR